jgi:hypothetical protein
VFPDEITPSVIDCSLGGPGSGGVESFYIVIRDINKCLVFGGPKALIELFLCHILTVGNKTLTMFFTFGKTSPLLKKELS